jgi:hypothetical protein
MGCDNSNDYILNIFEKIKLKQDCNINPCEEKLGMNSYMYNTIPLMFICKNNCDWYIAKGVFNDPVTNVYKCFKTPVFRLIKVDQERKIATLELLQPQTSKGQISPFSCKNEVCDFFSSVSISKFIRTSICIKININCFSGVKCLEPVCAKKGIPKGIINNPHVIPVETSEYITVSDGIKQVYLNSDGIKGFNVICDPFTISYSNLFINGMLQPPSFYTLTEGKLILNTEDVPSSGTVIILQLVKIIK